MTPARERCRASSSARFARNRPSRAATHSGRAA
eukprot:CAMPEP_0170231882 /NCGR_PEP_ID=MMETSP0116_2-20130129/15678_1 /TAXON_ID=400756 /ORGANISM="Durinskia baltica, Strain CSIRO CS-38" /LENGTH=32 /DNA_ID= /DNA_START= /DNA_END= /DNA_ORIENTATION=